MLLHESIRAAKEASLRALTAETPGDPVRGAQDVTHAVPHPGVEVEGGRDPTADWMLNLQILILGGLR
jgi:hypothetical protein